MEEHKQERGGRKWGMDLSRLGMNCYRNPENPESVVNSNLIIGD